MKKIAFDFHGVLDTYPEIFKPMMRSLRQQYEVIVLSGPPKEQVFRELLEVDYIGKIHYDSIISVVDWIKDSGVKMSQHENGNWYTDDETWWGSKAKICNAFGIEVMFDDKLEYKEHIKDNNPLFVHIQ